MLGSTVIEELINELDNLQLDVEPTQEIKARISALVDTSTQTINTSGLTQSQREALNIIETLCNKSKWVKADFEKLKAAVKTLKDENGKLMLTDTFSGFEIVEDPNRPGFFE